MQNFKSFLSEEDKKGYLRFGKTLIINKKPNADINEDKVTNDIVQMFKDNPLPSGTKLYHRFGRIDNSQIKLGFQFNVLEAKFGSDASHEPIIEQVKDVFEQLPYVSGKSISDNTDFCYITYGLPEFNVDTSSKIYLGIDGVSAPPSSLHNIHKIISGECLIIDVPRRIKDSVLGLLLIKKLGKLEEGRFIDKWCGIVIKHFYTDKDVLECQEELITKGFRQYAKL
jgi:hypothetical protein